MAPTKMQIIADHISNNLIRSRKRYHHRSLSLTSFKGMIPITVGEIGPIHQRSAKCTAVLRDNSMLGLRYVTPATIAKLRKIKICEAVLFNSCRRDAIKVSFSISVSGLLSTPRFYSKTVFAAPSRPLLRFGFAVDSLSQLTWFRR